MVVFCSRVMILMAVLIVANGCSQVSNFAPLSQSNERDVQSQSASAQQAIDPNDPLVAHMLARQAVDPVHVSKRNAYVHSVDEYPQYQGKKELRVTRFVPPLPPAMPERKADLVTPMQKPAHVSKIAFSGPASVKPVVQNSLTVTSLQLRDRGAAIQGVRLGEHPDKTRIVVDVSEDVSFRAWMQDENHVLVMLVEDSHVATQRGKVLRGHPLVKAYGFRQGDDGAQEFIVTFKKPVNLTYKAKLEPNSTYQNYRIVVDLKA